MSAFHVCFPGQSLGGEEHEEVKWTHKFRLMAYEWRREIERERRGGGGDLESVKRSLSQSG